MRTAPPGNSRRKVTQSSTKLRKFSQSAGIRRFSFFAYTAHVRESPRLLKNSFERAGRAITELADGVIRIKIATTASSMNRSAEIAMRFNNAFRLRWVKVCPYAPHSGTSGPEKSRHSQGFGRASPGRMSAMRRIQSFWHIGRNDGFRQKLPFRWRLNCTRNRHPWWDDRTPATPWRASNRHIRRHGQSS